MDGLTAIELVRLLRRKKRPAKLKPKPKETLSTPAVSAQKATIRGEIKYPWGTVAYATITAGDKSAVADGAGRYEIPIMEPGVHTVSVKAPFAGYEAAPQTVTLAAGEAKVVDFSLDFEKTVVHGCVYGADSKPIAGAALSGVMSGGGVETAVTDEKGYFKIQNASPGNQFIRVNAPGHMAQTRDFAAKKGEETKLEFHLVAGSCKLYGTVVDENDHPLRAEMVLSSASGVILQKSQTNGETGYYEFAVLPARYNLLATALEYTSKGWRGQVSADEKHDFRLEPSMARRASTPSSQPPETDARPVRSPW